MLRVATALGLIGIVGVAIAALVRGPDFLETTLPFGVPVGNAIAVSGLVSVGLLAMLVSRGMLRILSGVALAVAIAWYPLSIVIAGNPRLNFQGDSSRCWLLLTVTTLVLLFASLLLGCCQQLYRRLVRRG